MIWQRVKVAENQAEAVFGDLATENSIVRQDNLSLTSS
jgi:hypothetical protein